VQVLKFGALSANIVSEEPIDLVLHEACTERDTIWTEWEKVRPWQPSN
jgi:hypothetical protein